MEPVKKLEQLWYSYRAGALASDAAWMAKIRSRQAFYAGVMTMLDAERGLPAAGPFIEATEVRQAFYAGVTALSEVIWSLSPPAGPVLTASEIAERIDELRTLLEQYRWFCLSRGDASFSRPSGPSSRNCLSIAGKRVSRCREVPARGDDLIGAARNCGNGQDS